MDSISVEIVVLHRWNAAMLRIMTAMVRWTKIRRTAVWGQTVPTHPVSPANNARIKRIVRILAYNSVWMGGVHSATRAQMLVVRERRPSVCASETPFNVSNVMAMKTVGMVRV